MNSSSSELCQSPFQFKFLKLIMVGADFISIARLLHNLAPRNENPFWPSAIFRFLSSDSFIHKLSHSFLSSTYLFPFAILLIHVNVRRPCDFVYSRQVLQ